MLCHSQRPFAMAVCLCSLAVLAPTIAQDLQPLPGRPWTAIIPDPDSFDWSRNNRPGYRYRGMEPMQQRFYDYIRQKREAGTELTWADRATIRQMIAARRWPEGSRPNEFWAAYMRYLRGLPNDDLNTAQTLMLTDLTRFGYVALDRPPNEVVKRLQEYLQTGPFEARNWFERSFGRAEEWMNPFLDYQLASHGFPLTAPGSGASGVIEDSQLRLEYTMSGGSFSRITRRENWHDNTLQCAPGATVRISGRIRVSWAGATVRASAGAIDGTPQGKVKKQEFIVEGGPEGSREPSWHPFEASLVVPAGSSGVSLEVSASWRAYGRGSWIKASARTPANLVAGEAAPADASWAAYVNETLARLGYSDTPLGLELKRMRDALAGTDADWKRYVDAEQQRLGYDPSPEAAAYRELTTAAAAGGEPWAAHVDQLPSQPPTAVQPAQAPVQEPPAAQAPTLSIGTDFADGNLTGVATTFERPTQLTVRADFQDLPPQTTVVTVWYRDGQEAIRGQRITGGNGFVTFTLGAGGQPLPPGRYRVEITAPGKLLGQAEFTVR